MDLKGIIKKHKPSKAEEKQIMDCVKDVIERINLNLKKKGIKATVMLGGSAAKGTMLMDDFDCDIFVRFDYSYKDKDLSTYLKYALKNFKNKKIIHGSRDYCQIKNKNISYEIVPVLDINHPKQAVNVTDASPLHVTWILSRIKKDPKLRDEIILTKVFCKAQGLYGAESYIQGFSGHVIDILIAYYGGFLRLLKNAAKWNQKVIIDIEKHHKDALRELNVSKTFSPLIVVDPIQPERNAAAAISQEKFDLFKEKAIEFLSMPSKKFFERKKITLNELKQKSRNKILIALNVTALKGKEDVIGGKLLKAFNYILKQFKLNEFNLIDKGWEWDKAEKALFWYIIKKEVLSEYRTWMGPPLKQKKAVEAFKEKHKATFIQGNRIYTKIKRMFRTPEDLANYMIRQEYIKEKIKKVRIS